MAVEIVVYCSEDWAGNGNALTVYNNKKAKILSSVVSIPEKIDRQDMLDYGYGARLQTGDPVSCRSADMGIGWNKKRRILVRIANMFPEDMVYYVNESYSIEKTFLGKTGFICKHKKRYRFTFPDMVVGNIYTFRDLKDAQMIDKTDTSPIVKVIG